MVPESWRTGSINGRSTPLNPSLYNKAADIIIEALSAYPKEFLVNHLKGIGIVDSLSFYNVQYGGTAAYANKVVVIVVKSYSYEHTVSTIHHEFNHLLVYHNEFPEAQWSALNRSGFSYSGGGVQAIQNGQSDMNFTDAMIQQGFACQYGQSALIEDVATFVEFAFMRRSEFIRRISTNSIALSKFNILKRFYYNLNNSFDDNFWSGNSNITNKNNQTVINKTQNETSVNKYSYSNGYFQLTDNRWNEVNQSVNRTFTQYNQDANYIYISTADSRVKIALPVGHNQAYILVNNQWQPYQTVTAENSVNTAENSAAVQMRYSGSNGLQIVSIDGNRWYEITSTGSRVDFIQNRSDENYYYINNSSLEKYLAIPVSHSQAYIWRNGKWETYAEIHLN